MLNFCILLSVKSLSLNPCLAQLWFFNDGFLLLSIGAVKYSWLRILQPILAFVTHLSFKVHCFLISAVSTILSVIIVLWTDHQSSLQLLGNLLGLCLNFYREQILIDLLSLPFQVLKIVILFKLCFFLQVSLGLRIYHCLLLSIRFKKLGYLWYKNCVIHFYSFRGKPKTIVIDIQLTRSQTAYIEGSASFVNFLDMTNHETLSIPIHLISSVLNFLKSIRKEPFQNISLLIFTNFYLCRLILPPCLVCTFALPLSTFLISIFGLFN